MSADDTPPKPQPGSDAGFPTPGPHGPSSREASSSTLPDAERTRTWTGSDQEVGGRAIPLPLVPGYEVLEVLGRGGMGVVYKARQTALQRIVALKMIRAGADASPEELARFRVEAQAVARLQHPNIVQIHEVNEHEGRPYFSLEFVPGGSLADRLRKQPFGARLAAELIETLARAVHHAHEHDIVHRDLKPGNVLLAPAPGRDAPTPKITDFGLAKQLDGDPAAAWTRSDAVMGTPAYMAPEQAWGRPESVGPSADVYALGAILYELLAGRPPFQGPTALDVVEKVRHQDPVPPRRLRPNCPRDLETICLKCLRKEPAKRYGSAQELADDLHRFLEHEPIRARPVGVVEKSLKWLRRRPAGVLSAALVLLAVLTTAGGGWLWHEVAAAEGRTRAAREANLVTTAWYANMTRRRGEPEGVGPIAEAQAVQRLPGYRFHIRGGKVERIDVLNNHLRFEDHASLPALLGFARPVELDFPRDASLHYTRDEAGRVVQEEARDPWGQINWTFRYLEDLTGYFIDRRVSPTRREVTRRVHVHLDWDDAGLVREMRFADQNGRPSPTDQGVHGVRLDHDDSGLISRLTYLGVEGKPRANGDLPAFWAEKHDAGGVPVEETYFDENGKPAAWLSYHRKVLSLSGAGELVETFFDAKGKPVASDAGFHRVTTRTARRGAEAEFAYFGVDGRPVIGRQGFHRCAARYDPLGAEVEMSYFDPDGKPATHDDDGGYSRRTAVFDERGTLLERAYWVVNARGEYLLHLREDAAGNQLERAYFDAKGNPVVDRDSGAHRWTARYDDAGHQVEMAWFGMDGQPALHRRLNHHRWTATFDARGRMIEGANFGTRSEPVMHAEGMHRWTATYDFRGNKTGAAYFGLDNQPVVLPANGSHRWTARYDRQNRRVEEVHFGTDGRPVVALVGFAKCTWAFDRAGQLSETTTWMLDARGEYVIRRREEGGLVTEEGLFDSQGRPTTDPAGGFHRWKGKYDAERRLTEKSFFGLDGAAVINQESGNHRWVVKYDERGNETEGTNFGTNGEPVLHRSGMHRWVDRYDERNRVIEHATFGVRGEPIIVSGTRSHRWTKQYDDRDRVVEERHFDTDDKPVVCKQGFARRTWVYDGDAVKERAWWLLDNKGELVLSRRDDGQDKILERRYYTPAGEPGVDPTSGAHRVLQSFERGNLTEQAFFNLEGEPVLHKSVGTHKRVQKYNDRNLLVEVAHFDKAGKAMVMPGAGSHGWAFRYDDRGNKAEQTYFGVDHEPVDNRYGYHKSTIRYDEVGKEAGRVYTDVKGNIVEPKKPAPDQ